MQLEEEKNKKRMNKFNRLFINLYKIICFKIYFIQDKKLD